MRNPKTSAYVEDIDDEEDDVPYDEEEEVEDNDDIEEEEDEEEDEDEDPRPRKRALNPFIDEMALVDEDEEEEEEEEDYGREDGFIDEETEEIPSEASMQRRNLDLDRRRREMEDMDDEQVAAFYAQKYGGRRAQTFKSSEEVPQQLLLPSPGKEKDIILGMMKRYFDRLYSDVPLDTFSSFARESLKGYIYIEARKLSHVQQAIANIPHVYQTTLMLVPIQDMIDSINIQKKVTEIPVGGWVRVTRGTYNGDLGKVIEVSDSQDTALIKLIPRLALDQTEDDYKNNTRAEEHNAEDNKKKRKKPAAVRPPQRLFNPERLNKRHISSLQKKGPYWVLGTDNFRDGYLEKNIKVTSLQVEDVSPSLEEITRFIGESATGEEGDRALDLSAASLQAVNDAQATSLLQPGDIIEVVEGDMIHSVGSLESINDGAVRVTLNMDGFRKSVTLAAKQVRKKFSEGDHVKVIHGLRKDESGMVVKVEGNVITMVSDSSLEEVKVFAKDLRVAAEVTLGKTTIGNYELHDLVQLDFHTVGTIVKVDKSSLKVMTQNGDIRTLSPHQITNKRNNQRAVATDANGNSITAGDTVMEVRGERRTCTVLHIYRHLVFLHSRENMANFGVWVENTRSVVSMSPKERQQSRDSARQPHNNNGQNFRGGFDGRGRGRGAAGRGGFFGRGRGGRDNLISKTVRVTQGPHKGYVGIVKDATDSMARVELHTNSKVINVDKAKLVLIGIKGETVGPVLDADHRSAPADSFNSRPPMTPKRYGDGAMTPRHYSSGSQTPAWSMNSRTPNPYANDGSKTPAWDLGSKTPNPHAYNDGSKTPAWDSGSKTPSWKAETPRWNSSGGRTPGFNDYGDRSPTWSGSNSNRYSDRDVAPTPAAHTMAPATPAASSNNVAPSPAPFPQTPGANFPQTPYDSAPTPYDGAPTPGANLAPATPAALTAPTPAAHMLSAPTPGGYIPSTPAGSVQPQTPFRPTGGDYGHIEEQAEDTSDWPIEEIEVKVTKSADGAQSGQLASIVSVDSSSRTCTVTLNDGGARAELPFDNMEPVRPSKKDPVKVFLGQHRGGIGALIGVDGHDGILRLKGQGTTFKFVSINHVGKYTGSEISNGVV
ncbi:hypothetical protein BDA99DRAFT_546151 [Phascolomyces articulosus]|uniref:Transcription elongation factor SPT5 n=1 Tax=Phascolomyces articulosus TaxID=60185 RepID=A0AAD5PFZ6_9FUNG|nr:hypothetical protein BDA99DRAFT_546151 [Phascolomyces articulosus]